MTKKAFAFPPRTSLGQLTVPLAAPQLDLVEGMRPWGGKGRGGKGKRGKGGEGRDCAVLNFPLISPVQTFVESTSFCKTPQRRLAFVDVINVPT